MEREGARAAVRIAVNAEMSHRGWNIADLKDAAQVDPGTIADFLEGHRWPQIKTLGKIERAVGWPAGTIAGMLAGGSAPDVGGRTQDQSEEEVTLRFRRPDGITDEKWEQLKAEAEGIIEWTIDRASRER